MSSRPQLHTRGPESLAPSAPLLGPGPGQSGAAADSKSSGTDGGTFPLASGYSPPSTVRVPMQRFGAAGEEGATPPGGLPLYADKTLTEVEGQPPKVIVQVTNNYYVQKAHSFNLQVPLLLALGAFLYAKADACNNPSANSWVPDLVSDVIGYAFLAMSAWYFVKMNYNTITNLAAAKYNNKRALVEQGYLTQAQQNATDMSIASRLSTFLDFAITGMLAYSLRLGITSNPDEAFMVMLLGGSFLKLVQFGLDMQVDIARHKQITNTDYQTNITTTQTGMKWASGISITIGVGLILFAFLKEDASNNGKLGNDWAIAGCALLALGAYLFNMDYKLRGGEAVAAAVDTRAPFSGSDFNTSQSSCPSVFGRRDLNNEFAKLAFQFMFAGVINLMIKADEFSVVPAIGALIAFSALNHLFWGKVADDYNAATVRLYGDEYNSASKANKANPIGGDLEASAPASPSAATSAPASAVGAGAGAGVGAAAASAGVSAAGAAAQSGRFAGYLVAMTHHNGKRATAGCCGSASAVNMDARPTYVLVSG